MIKERAWPAKAMYLLIAAALAMSLILMAAPALKVDAATDDVDAEWDRVSTPTTEGWVLAPYTVITDYAVGDDGEVAYAIVNGYNFEEDASGSWLLKSEDHAATWDDDISDELEDALDDDGYSLDMLLRVACDPEDSEFVAVALCTNEADDTCVHVYISTDGGDSFEDGDTGEVEDGAYFDSGWDVTDLAVSTEDDGEHEIAIVGQDDDTDAVIFRCQVDGDHPGKWEDARYDGWDDDDDFEASPDPVSMVVTDVKFAPSWDVDKTILVTTVVDEDGGSLDPDDLFSVYLQTGTWGSTEGWNEQSLASIPAVLINSSPVLAPFCLATVIGMQDFRGIAGLTLPLDYAGRHSNKRYAWVWMNYYSDATGNPPESTIYKVKDDDADPVGPMGQIEDGEVWLTNVDYLGYISEGKAVAGVLGTGGYAYNATDECDNYYDIFTDCCEGVQVYSNDGIVNMDICCEPWEDSCKPPTGTKAMAAFYASDDPATSKAYAVALWAYNIDFDEGAWSVSFDDGYTWNQLSLIDTYIDYLSDVAVSPDCNKTMLVSINDCDAVGECCGCDSTWLHAENLPEAEEYSGKWLRTWCGELEGDHDPDNEWGFLRLAPEETTGDTVYLVDYYTDIVYWNELETLGCWEDGTATADNIVDLAVKDRETIFALDDDGSVAMSDDYALGWHEPVDSKVEEGYTIAVWGDHILVGGCDGDVSYSDDGGETFTELEDIADTGCVTVAFDSYFLTNNTVYAAVAEADNDDNGVYSFVLDESEEWKDLRAEPTEIALCCDDDAGRIEVHFTGLVVDTADGNPMTSADTGGVLYASFYYDANGYCGDLTGVARRLNPAEETVCPTCVEWDYLIAGLTDYTCMAGDCPNIEESFDAIPDALKICGCLTPDSNSKLFAIDSTGYEMFHEEFDKSGSDGQDGTVWMFEDCYAKKAPDLISPYDGGTLPSDPCECIPLPFTMKWDRLCDACSYDIQIALDEDFNEVIFDSRHMCDSMTAIDPCCSYRPPEGETPSAYFMDIWGEYRLLICEFTYYWRVRAADAATDQIIHSWWSDAWSFTVAPGPGTGVELISPENGATGVAVKDIPFSWSEVASADEYDWMLSANSDLSTPISTLEGLTNTAGTYSGTALDYETPYFWQVTALKDGSPISTSEVGTFTTAEAAEFCCPQCGLCFDTRAELQEHIEEMHAPVTPMWVWVIIAIGAVLVIVVIVLIFRTRRV